MKEYQVPEWIVKGTDDIKKAFLKSSFDCEGSIHYSYNRKCWEIKYSMYKNKEMDDNLKSYLSKLKNMLLDFGIESSGIQKKEEYSRNKDGLRVLGRNIRISKKESIVNFYRKIGFDNRIKAKRLTQAFKDNIYKCGCFL